MNIRKANLFDIENNLLNLYIDGFKFHYEGRKDIFSDKKESELKEELINKINSSNILVLEIENKILGYIAYQIKENHNRVMWIDQLVVDKNNRNLGYGSKLIEKIKDMAKEEDCKRVEFCCWSFNQNALNMYKHMGYEEQRVIFEMNV